MSQTESEVVRIPIDLIEADPDNVRQDAGDDLEDLMGSIEHLGQLQPIGVIATGGDCYRVSYGNRRLLAMRKLGETTILAVVCRFKDEGQALAAQTAENVVRRDLRPVERWRAMRRLIDGGMSLVAAATVLGMEERAARQLDVLGRIAQPVLDYIAATDDMPDHRQLRLIALRDAETQASVWKQHAPSKNSARCDWMSYAQALVVRSISRRHAIFDDAWGAAHGVTWQTDWLAPPDEGEHTNDVAAYMEAQGDWIVKKILPELDKKKVRGCKAATNEYGSIKVPKGVTQIHKPMNCMKDWLTLKKVPGHVLGFAVAGNGSLLTEVWIEPPPAAAAASAGGTPDAPAAKAPRPDGMEREAPYVTQDGLKLLEKAKRQAAAEAIRGDDLPGLIRTLATLVRHVATPLTDPSGRLLRAGGTGKLETFLSPTEAAAEATAMIRHLILHNEGRVPLTTVERVGEAWGAVAGFPLDSLEMVKKPGLEEIAKAAGISTTSTKTQAGLRVAITGHFRGHGMTVIPASYLPVMAWALPRASDVIPGKPEDDNPEDDEDDEGGEDEDGRDTFVPPPPPSVQPVVPVAVAAKVKVSRKKAA